MSEQQVKNIITTARQKLLAHRNKERPRPGLDDKIIVAWNGLAIASLARAGAALESINPERSKEMIRDAEQAAEFIRRNLYDGRTHELKRVWREGAGETPGFADDYAYLIMGLLNLYEATFEVKYLRWADTLQRKVPSLTLNIYAYPNIEKQISLFWDSQSGGFFSTPSTSTDLILRLKDGLDSQEPSTNGTSTINLHRLATILSSPPPSSPSFLTYATQTCDAFSPEILQHPFLFCSLLPAIVASNLGIRSVVLAGDPEDPELKKQRSRLRGKLLTNTTIVQVDPKKVKSGDEDVRWLLGRNEVLGEVLNRVEKKGKGMVQICEGNRCLDVWDMGNIEAAIEELG